MNESKPINIINYFNYSMILLLKYLHSYDNGNEARYTLYHNFYKYITSMFQVCLLVNDELYSSI